MVLDFFTHYVSTESLASNASWYPRDKPPAAVACWGAAPNPFITPLHGVATRPADALVKRTVNEGSPKNEALPLFDKFIKKRVGPHSSLATARLLGFLTWFL